jgi:hypothetical protein
MYDCAPTQRHDCLLNLQRPLFEHGDHPEFICARGKSPPPIRMTVTRIQTTKLTRAIHILGLPSFTHFCHLKAIFSPIYSFSVQQHGIDSIYMP